MSNKAKNWADKLGEVKDIEIPPTIDFTPIVVDPQVKIKVLQRELYLAKARILELELKELGVKPQSES